MLSGLVSMDVPQLARSTAEAASSVTAGQSLPLFLLFSPLVLLLAACNVIPCRRPFPMPQFLTWCFRTSDFTLLDAADRCGHLERPAVSAVPDAAGLVRRHRCLLRRPRDRQTQARTSHQSWQDMGRCDRVGGRARRLLGFCCFTTSIRSLTLFVTSHPLAATSNSFASRYPTLHPVALAPFGS